MIRGFQYSIPNIFILRSNLLARGLAWAYGVFWCARNESGSPSGDLLDCNITIPTRLVDTVSTPMLFNSLQSKKIDPTPLITHRFKLDHILDAYETFGHATDTHALEVIIAA
jgi:threonine dehydrogenase-like Zn-dependent dehydrogenase